MLRNIVKILGMGSLCLFLLGCSEENFLMQKADTEVVDENGNNTAEDDDSFISAIGKDVVYSETTTSGIMQSETETGIASQETVKEIAVHICGAVKQPGVYYLKEKQRLHQGIDMAGGFREDADENYLNQALVLEDGMKIVVPTVEETAVLKKAEENTVTAEEELIQKGDLQYKENKSNADSKVDLNTADEKLLCTLPGIGESRAKSIIAYRIEHGAFQHVEDVMKVSGIKEAAFEKIKEYVTVSE